MDIAIIGMGRLGRTVSHLLSDKNIFHYRIKRTDAIPKADLYYILVPDRDITGIAQSIESGILLHASGAQDHRILRPHKPVGVLHPIMSFPGPEISVPSPPIPASMCGDPEGIKAAQFLGELLGFQCFEYNGNRTLYHAAAVLAGNFSTSLIHFAANLIETEKVSKAQAIQMLTPLALQSIHQAHTGTLSKTLTGPVSRNDTKVITDQLRALKTTHPTLFDVYDSLLKATLKQLNVEKD